MSVRGLSTKKYTPGSVDGATHPSSEGCEGFPSLESGERGILSE